MPDREHDREIDGSGEPVPEADALEQREALGDDDEDDRAGAVADEMDETPDDVPEADALEQATPLPGAEEEDAPR